MPKKIKKLRKGNVRRRHKSDRQQAIEHEYRKVRTRVHHRLSEYRTKGYDVTDIKVPAIPKRITEGSVRSLSKITTEYIRKHSTVPTAMDISTGEVTQSISGIEYYKEKQKEARHKAAKTRKRRKSKKLKYGDSWDDEDSSAPHIGDLIAARIRDIISRYAIEDTQWARQMEYWLQIGEKNGTIINLATWNSSDINDVDIDAFYVSRGQPPKRGSLDLLKQTLTGEPMTAEEAAHFEDFTDGDADQFDEESFFGATDDEDDY